MDSATIAPCARRSGPPYRPEGVVICSMVIGVEA